MPVTETVMSTLIPVLLLIGQYWLLVRLPKTDLVYALEVSALSGFGKSLFFGISVLWVVVALVYPAASWQNAVASPIILWMIGLTYSFMRM